MQYYDKQALTHINQLLLLMLYSHISNQESVFSLFSHGCTDDFIYLIYEPKTKSSSAKIFRCKWTDSRKLNTIKKYFTSVTNCKDPSLYPY